MSTDTRTSRRSFLKKTAAAGAAATLTPAAFREGLARSAPPSENGPIAIASGNGVDSVELAYEMMQDGDDALDAVIAGVNIVEEDPDDVTVGYGGIPNEEGVVQLDAGVMHGPTHRAGSVGALEGIMHPSKVARLVMERTDHALLVAEGAQRFARMHGFTVENLLTDSARERWLEWKETLSDDDNYLPPDDPDDTDLGAEIRQQELHHGTIHCSGLDAEGNISSVTTTSGLFYKMPGRVGDSPIIGAGLYADNEIGAAGSTGRGEANLQNLSSFLIVELMRMGHSPEQACITACERIANHTRVARLLDDDGRPNFNVRFYALNKQGEFGGAEIHQSGGGMAVADADVARRIDVAYLFEE